MTKKEAFIEIVKKEIFNEKNEKIMVENYLDIFEDAKVYFTALEADNKPNKKFWILPKI